MTPQQIKEVFRKIASGERRHGGFLTTFAEAMMMADDQNFALLIPCAKQLIDKYNIAHYAKVGLAMATVSTPVGSDVCVCGDYRSQHDRKGFCRVCAGSRAPYDGCTQFRFSRHSTPEEVKHWQQYHAEAK